MTVMSVITLCGGIGLFLYGMKLLSASLERIAGAGLERTLEKLTSNRLKGVLLGAVVTAAIQSSAATAIMAVGFVNAGIMKLVQAVPVILGANIGTTITGQILRLGDISDDNLFLMLLKPSSFAPLCITIGAAILLVSKKKRTKDFASILIGFSILFVGMTTMETTLAPLKDSPKFQQIFFLFKNPFLGVLVGALVTAILQSSSASVGVLQAVSSTGTVTFSMAAPIIMGQNIGKCVTVLIASIGTSKKAKRAVYIDLIVNLLGAAFFLVAVYGYQALVGFPFWDDVVNRGNIADFHSLFNIVTCILVFPFTNQLIKFSRHLVKNGEASKIEEGLAGLNDIFLNTPAVALEQCKKAILSMGETVRENFEIAVDLFRKYDDKKGQKLEENERFLDRTESVMVDFLLKITAKDISTTDSRLATEIMHSVSDFEKIGDYCGSLAHEAELHHEQNVTFSADGLREFSYAVEAVRAIIGMTVQAYQEENPVIAARVEPLEQTVDLMEETLKSKHIERLQSGACSTKSGISFVEVLNDMDRIASHCANIALHLTQRLSANGSFDAHAHVRDANEELSDEYKALCHYYESKYLEPVR